MSANQDDFQAALATEFEFTPETPEATPPAPTPAGGEESGEQPKAGTEGEQPVPPAAGEQPKPGEPTDPQDNKETPPGENGEQPKPGDEKQETPEEKANREAEEAANAEPPKPLTTEDIRKALAEDRAESEGRVNKLHTAREEIISKLYPEGVDQHIYDSNGNVIKTAQDIVDRGLINERTGEAYTYEEASSFMLEAGKQMAKNVEDLNNWAEQIAEQNISLIEGNYRVMEQWGDLLKAMPDLADELAAEYITTQLEFDDTKSYITKMNVSPETYYKRALAPYKELGKAYAAKQALDAAAQAKAAEEEKEQKQNEQNERLGLPPQRGESAQKANTGDPMLDALVNELNLG